MPVQRIVMPDGTTKAFRENASRADIDRACAESAARMKRLTVTQTAPDVYCPAPPSVRNHTDVVATPEQRDLAIAQAQTLRPDTQGWEWSTSYKNGAFSDWATIKNQAASEIDPDGDFSLHYHPGSPSNFEIHRKNFNPGPCDPIVPAKYNKPAFILTPDRNTLLELGIRGGKYYADPVWQKPGTKARRSYDDWQPGDD